MYTQFYRFFKQLPAVLRKIRKTAKKLLPNFPFSCILYKQHYDGPLAQLVEHLTLNQGVVGSRPTWVTKIWPVGQAVKTPPFHGGIRGSIPLPVTIRALSSAGRASALQAECRRFEPVIAQFGTLEKWLNSPAFHAGIQGFESPTCQKLTDNFLLYVSFLLGFEREDDAERVAKMKSSSPA